MFSNFWSPRHPRRSGRLRARAATVTVAGLAAAGAVVPAVTAGAAVPAAAAHAATTGAATTGAAASSTVPRPPAEPFAIGGDQRLLAHPPQLSVHPGLGTASTGTRATSGVPLPPVAPGLADVPMDPVTPYVPQNSCDDVLKPGVAKFEALIETTYPGTGSSGDAVPCGTDGTISEHFEGRAWDWTVSVRDATQKADADALTGWLMADNGAMARRLGIMYMIWDDRIWGVYNTAAGWRNYSGCPTGNATSCHEDHVHFSFSWAGAQARTSWWSGQPAAVDYGPCRLDWLTYAPADTGAANPTPCPAVDAAPSATGLQRWSGAVLRQGSYGPAVPPVQQALGVTADGTFGQQTLAALTSYQQQHGVPVTGVTDVATWAVLLGVAASPAPPVPPAGPVPDLSRGIAVAGADDLAGVSADGVPLHLTSAAATGLSVEPLGGLTISRPAIAAGPGGRLDVAVLGANHLVYWDRRTGGTWSGWRNLGLTSGAAPSAAVSPDGTLTIAATDAGQATQYLTVSPQGRLSPWQALGGVAAAATGPAVAANAAGVVVLVHGTDNRLWDKTVAASSAASGWRSAGGALGGDPVATTTAAGRTTVLVRDTAGAPSYQDFTGVVGSGWHRMSGATAATPAIGSDLGSPVAHAAVVGTNGHLYLATRTDTGWTTWQRVGGT